MKYSERRITCFEKEVYLVFFENLLLILAALFLCITFFLAAMSASETTLSLSLAELVFLAFLIAVSSLVVIAVLIFCFLAEPRSCFFIFCIVDGGGILQIHMQPYAQVQTAFQWQ